MSPGNAAAQRRIGARARRREAAAWRSRHRHRRPFRLLCALVLLLAAIGFTFGFLGGFRG